tara:strand:- start:70 stop:279 length:210 start_codon:yes stop_codon:yes gene_type:complete
MADILNNKEVLIFLIGALVKKNGGTLRISKEEVLDVKSKDILTLAYDKQKEEIVLMSVNTEEKEEKEYN